MFASAPLSSPSHFAGTRSADRVAAADETLSRVDVFAIVAVVVGIAAVIAPSVVIPAVVVVAFLVVAWFGLQGLGQALEPIAEGRIEAASAAALVNRNFNR
jgi:hypothetical protein